MWKRSKASHRPRNKGYSLVKPEVFESVLKGTELLLWLYLYHDSFKQTNHRRRIDKGLLDERIVHFESMGKLLGVRPQTLRKFFRGFLNSGQVRATEYRGKRCFELADHLPPLDYSRHEKDRTAGEIWSEDFTKPFFGKELLFWLYLRVQAYSADSYYKGRKIHEGQIPEERINFSIMSKVLEIDRHTLKKYFNRFLREDYLDYCYHERAYAFRHLRQDFGLDSPIGGVNRCPIPQQ